MPTAPDFSQPTKDLLAQRSAMICNNPECLTVTVGPYDAAGDLALKLGEAAHIRAARDGEARYDSSMTDEQRAHHTNGIWLCRHCHGLIDKLDGKEFTRDTIEGWKKDHQDMISVLIRAHRSPIAYLRKLTDEGRTAQAVVDIADQHAALFADMAIENPPHVIESLKRLRAKLSPIVTTIQVDKELKAVLQRIMTFLREAMSQTSQNPGAILSELPALRNRIGQQLKVLRDHYGCTIPPNLTVIIPN